VKSTLQLFNSKSPSNESSENIFALGDVAETNGAKMARAGMQQAEIVQENIVSLIKDRKASLKSYVPTYLEGSLKLSLGKVSLFSCPGSLSRLTASSRMPQSFTLKMAIRAS
jgi:NADH dehydrogenase FAD-containing subunit